MLFQPSECDELLITAPVAIVSDRGCAAAAPLEAGGEAGFFAVNGAPAPEASPATRALEAQVLARGIRRRHYMLEECNTL